ncbi:MAG: aminotransferase class I/II-fold pyridoxal phosphate-dependent enzyme [Bdellovibrionales bacterium]|nr:aminotransferase class I/II-fold pyridoxal phosphate-dependent enzyme [Bdellovibrionales bacterium]
MKDTALRIADFKDSIFGVISRLARENNAVNLGQGFPDFDGPDWLKDIAYKKMQEGHNQYAPFPGTANLRQEISNYYSKFYSLNYNAESEITVTVGATEAIYLVITALINPGDEVVVLEPFYDSYVASIKMAGGIPVPVTMHAPDFTIDQKELEAAVTSKTKLLILNNPHNPTGKVWSKEELVAVSNVAIKNDLYLLSDEVYEFLVFDGVKHLPTATLAGMMERTITVSSAGKTFGLTGWKIGWICANQKVTHACRLVHQYVTFSVSTPMQEAVAEGLKKLPDYLPGFVSLYKGKRDWFYQEMKQLGFEFAIPKGTYFMMVPLAKHTTLKDVDYALKLITEKKVATVPPSAFYLKSTEGEKYLRFCFAKKEETLKSAIQNLKGL